MTQLCEITGCRLRGRHLPACDDDQCAGCLPRVADEGRVCDACLQRIEGRLAAIAQLAPDARLVAAGLVRLGDNIHGGGKPGSRPPLNDDATDALDAVENALTTIARDIAETRGLHPPRDGHARDPLAAVCSWLAGQLTWLRHATDEQGGPYADSVFAEIGDCLARLRGIVNGPRAQRYLGPCGAESVIEAPGYTITNRCEGDVRGPVGGKVGRCRTCGAEVDQDERRIWLNELARSSDLVWTARGIADALLVSVKTIRSWAADRRTEGGQVLRRARLGTFWRRADGALVPWVEPAAGSEAQQAAELKARGDRLHYVADVAALAEEAADRREQRAAARAAESEAA